MRDDHQHGIADGLSGKRSAGGAERDGNVKGVGLVQDGCNLPLVPGPDHEFGNQAVERSVRSVGQGAE